MLLDRPDEGDVFHRLRPHPLQHVHSQAKREAGAAPSRDEDDLVILQRVREGPVRTVHRGFKLGAWVVQSVLVKVTSEAVISINNKLHRLAGDDSKGVALKHPDLRDPDEAVLAGLDAKGLLRQRDLGTAIWQGLQGGLIVDSPVQKSTSSKRAVGNPHGGDEAEYDDDPSLEAGLVVTRADYCNDEAGDVDDVEGLVPDPPDDNGGDNNPEESKAGDDASGDAGFLEQFSLAIDQEVASVHRGMEDEIHERSVTGDLV